MISIVVLSVLVGAQLALTILYGVFRTLEVRGLRREKTPPPPRPRKGIITAQFVGTGLINKGAQYNITADVIEEAVVGANSLIKVTKVYGAGVGDFQEKDIASQLSGWRKTDSIIWRND